MEPNFHDRMYMASESVYAAIERGEYRGQGTAPIEPALLDAQLDASDDEQDGDSR